MAIRDTGGGHATPWTTCFTIAKYLASGHIFPAIRTVEGRSRLSIIKDADKGMNSCISEVDRTNIIAFEVPKASRTVHSLPVDKQMTTPNTAQAIKRPL